MQTDRDPTIDLKTQQSRIKAHTEACYSNLDPTVRNKLQFGPNYIPILSLYIQTCIVMSYIYP